MLQLLKRIFLYICFLFVRATKRRHLLDTLAPKYKKHEPDIIELPVVLDELTHLPGGWQDHISFVGFDSQGSCIRIMTDGKCSSHRSVRLDLDLLGHGHFQYKDSSLNNIQLSDSSQSYGGRRVRISCLDPMKRWKISFRGLLNQANVGGKRVHASVLLYWQCLFDPFDHMMSPSCWKLAGYFSCLTWKIILTTPSLFDNALHYEQWGELRGRIDIQGFEKKSVRLRCMRKRDFGHTTRSNVVVDEHHFLLKESGLSFSHQIMKLNNESVYLGYLTYPIGDRHPIQLHHEQTLSSDKGRGILKFPQEIKENITFYNVSEDVVRNCFNGSEESVTFRIITINGRPGYGVQIQPPVKMLLEDEDALAVLKSIGDFVTQRNNKLNGQEPDIVTLDEPDCKIRSLVGGKAYHLAITKSLGRYNVPNGFCVTTNAFRQHISDHEALIEAAAVINTCLSESKIQTLKDKCDGAVTAVKQTALSRELYNSIFQHLENVFGNDWESRSFAVRSSGLNEDNIQTSAAGHLETTLGVQGLADIAFAVKDCWASTFSYGAVEYRRQNGHDLLENIGVVIQEMVAAEVSGVVFTVDPVTGDESNIVINANYGLGVSIVAGEVETDTIMVNRLDDDKLLIKGYQLGSKKAETVLSETARMETLVTSKAKQNRRCVQDNQITCLCETAITLENAYGIPLDIEWAVTKDELYILQVRPVTSLDEETDEDIIREFDSPVVSEEILITSSNAQEALPGAMSTLGLDLLAPASDKAMAYAHLSRIGLEPQVHAFSVLLTFSSFVFLNITQMAAKAICSNGDKAKASMEYQLIGQPVEEHTIQAVKDYIGREISRWKTFMSIVREFFILKRRDSILFERLKAKSESFAFKRHAKTAKELYKSIDDNVVFWMEMFKCYLFKLYESAVPAGHLMEILKGSNDELSTENLADMALVLSDCGGIVSAQVPSLIEDVAERISKSDIKEEFLRLPLEECDNFLKNMANEQIKYAYTQLLETHGHRGIREFDIFEKCWAQDPRNLIETIKLIIQKGSVRRKKKKLFTVSEIVDSMQTKLSWLQKIALKQYLVKSAIEGVARREIAKSYLIKVLAKFKHAYWKLAVIMVSECRLPETSLLFFLTHREIGELLENRSVKLIRLARRRRRIFPERDKIAFPKVSIGCPLPVQKTEHVPLQTAFFTLKGMPVSRGKAEGRACIVKSLQDTSQLKEGDVMICKLTDIGWSPYFPLISGLVTEIGGSLSHGAIIARECGIPCIVNTSSATDMFHTGDHVILDSTAGTVSKV